MQALILAGGEGTRLRPLTATIPKPVVPLAGRPFIVHMLAWLAGHGVDDVILACGFMAERVRAVLGDGEQLGVRLRYLEEPQPLGTGGALKFAEGLLEQRFLMLNGDVLCDLDLAAQLAQHERTGALGTLALVSVEDPTAYGLVRRNADLSVRQFVEKPGPEEIDTKLINAGCYVLERELLGALPPAGTPVSIERELFPALVGRGLYGFEASGYWLDIGTPERYLQGTFDILEGKVRAAASDEPDAAGRALGEGALIGGELRGPAIAGIQSELAPGALAGPRVVLGAGARVAAGARIAEAVILDRASIGERTRITRAIVGPGALIGADCVIEADVVIGAGARVGAGSVLRTGVRVDAGARIGAGSVLPAAAHGDRRPSDGAAPLSAQGVRR
jgi:mannose-1-phosphate guanylyltransferase